MENFTPILSSIGGVLIGLSASVLLLFNGRIAGISGIYSGLLAPKAGETAWRLAFVGGLVLGGAAMFLIVPQLFTVDYGRTLPMVALAGLIVGFGVRLGSGCTSGHGVCGISRLSPRSLVATVVFMFTGALTVFLVRTFFGGAA
jgi:uncharacterized membrane protein YedE/YeeE